MNSCSSGRRTLRFLKDAAQLSPSLSGLAFDSLPHSQNREHFSATQGSVISDE
jgi:hypothetical protein